MDQYLKEISGGIIPARAGFTNYDLLVRVGDEDHPRSRGVYIPGGVILRETYGSSPLARGLRSGASEWAPSDGIIPARAGFTTDRSVAVWGQ